MTAGLRLQQHVVMPGRVAFKAGRPGSLLFENPTMKLSIIALRRLYFHYIMESDSQSTTLPSRKRAKPEYPGNIDFCGLPPLVPDCLQFLQNDLNATVELSLQNAFALFVCFLRASERREKITTGSCRVLFWTLVFYFRL